ncbi:MAG: ketoacyl-ACP synthase III [Firmicutes bacterium]|jgi:3-oxoacyl-[acyl-carrier-protein] synthase-3|nr:ketoacyl-ACP synthase III [Bacillota bacterium]
MPRCAKIAGTGRYVPERVATNDELAERWGKEAMDRTAEVIGQRERHYAAASESAADLATYAAQDALRSAGIAATDLDLVIVATDTPEYVSPATASVVQHRLGASNAGTFDVNCACAAFVTAVDMGAKYILSDKAYRNVLVIGTYAMTKYVDWDDPRTPTILADGAGAVVLTISNSPGFLGGKLITDGQYHDYMGIYVGGSKTPANEESIKTGLHKVRFLKPYPPETNFAHWVPLIRETLAKAGLTTDDVNMYLFTQIRLVTIKEVMAEYGLPMDRTHCVMNKWGYTGSARIPMALDDAVKLGRIKPGDVVVLCASGGGYAMACTVFRWA